MTNENKKSKLGLFDYPEPAADFNNQISEASIDKSAAAYQAKRPDDTEFFKCFDPKGKGNVDDIKKYLTVNVPVKHRKVEYLVAGPPEFLRQVKADFSKVRIIRPAYYETVGELVSGLFLKLITTRTEIFLTLGLLVQIQS